MSVRHAVLGLLAERPDHGYRIKKRFEERVGQVWGLNIGQVYQTLQSLEANGLVRRIDAEARDTHTAPATQSTQIAKDTQSDKPMSKDRQRYELTQKGQSALDAWLKRQPNTPKPMRDELLVRLLLLGRERREQALARIDAQIRVYKRYLATLRARERKVVRAASENALGAVLGLDAARLHAEAHIRWLENCKLRFEDEEGDGSLFIDPEVGD